MIPKIRKCVVSLSLHTKSQLIIHQQIHNPLCYSITAFFFSSLQASEKRITYPTAEYLTIRHQFSPKTASKASSKVPFLRNPQRSESILSLLTENGCSKTHLENIISKYPRILSSHSKTIEAKIKFFLDLGFSPSELAEIVSSDPSILSRCADFGLKSSIMELKDILGTNEAVIKVLKRGCQVLRHGAMETVKPNMEFLKSCGVSSPKITSYFYKYPMLFICKPELLVKKVKRVEEMGFDMNSRRLIEAIRVVCSMTQQNWELKLDVFRRLGFSEDNIMGMFRRMPEVFGLSGKRIEEATYVFLNKGKVDLPYLVRHSELFRFSLVARVKPRLQVMEILGAKGLLRRRIQLTTMMMIPDKSFVEKYVRPFSKELGDDLVASWLSEEGPSVSVKVPILKEH